MDILDDMGVSKLSAKVLTNPLMKLFVCRNWNYFVLVIYSDSSWYCREEKLFYCSAIDT